MYKEMLLFAAMTLGLLTYSESAHASITTLANEGMVSQHSDSRVARRSSKKKAARIRKVAGVYSVRFVLSLSTCSFDQPFALDALIQVEQQNNKVATIVPSAGRIGGKTTKRGFTAQGKKVEKGYVLTTTATLKMSDKRHGTMTLQYRVLQGGSSCEIGYTGIAERA